MKRPWNWIKLVFVFLPISVFSQPVTKAITPAELRNIFQSPPPAASPWVFWYWNQASVSREAITADLEAMKQSGIGGAYLMTIKDTVSGARHPQPIRQLTPEWWEMIRFALSEAKRLNLQISMHVSDGFALAGGPWITPELSMQKVVWSTKHLTGGQTFNDTLVKPETIEGYYKDIAVFAYPSPKGAGLSSEKLIPLVTSNKGDSIARLLVIPGNKRTFGCDSSCWIQYQFDAPFTARTVIIRSRNNFQSNRLIIEVSDNGIKYRRAAKLEPPRTGWQDWDADYTHSIPPVTAKYFRFVFDKTGTEPGAEDIDAAKWKPSFRVTGIELLSEARIHQYEGKSGEVWRVSKKTTAQQISNDLCVPLNKVINISSYFDNAGKLKWNVPAGNWTILRMGHTSTGHKNETGGGGKGLECDKFNKAAIKLQFDNWFGKVFEQVDPAITSSVLKTLHIDSWECGSQNWSAVFRKEFRDRRGYDLLKYLPIMAGVPIVSAAVSEKFLHDVRATIAELISDKFYATLNSLAREKGCIVSAECVAPTMLSDGILHYKNVDVPMGEFWLRSPTHDKPNDMLDAISGGHIYGKNIIQAEAFTELRTTWDEHPGNLKSLQDRNYAMGINRLSYHVFMHNPWMNRKPGMTLDGIGLFFQRDQTWWKPGKAWVDYARRCQALLQIGKPVVDIAVFSGEELPARSVLPDRLVPILPGIFGKDVVEAESKRLANIDQPMKQSPVGVNHSANMAYPEDWVDPLRGYTYDCFNKDALMSMAKMKNGTVEFAPGSKYKLLVIPGKTKMDPDGIMSTPVKQRFKKLYTNGANIIDVPYLESTFDKIGLPRDLIATQQGVYAKDIAWTHRADDGLDIYFISNQLPVSRVIDISLRVSGRVPELWDAVSGEIWPANNWKIENGRTLISIKLEASGSIFIVLHQPALKISSDSAGRNWKEFKKVNEIENWLVTFDPQFGGPGGGQNFNNVMDWSKHNDPSIKYYSGTATYETSFAWLSQVDNSRVWLNLGKVANIAEVFVNGINCGIVWTEPYRVDISRALKVGKNSIVVEVTNTWANRIMGDQLLPENKRITKTNAPFRLEGKPLLEAGLLGPVRIEL